MEWLAGGAAFALFFLYDWNRVFWKKRWMNGFFMAGCVILGAVGAVFIWQGIQAGRGMRLLWLIPAAMLPGLLLGLGWMFVRRTEAREARWARETGPDSDPAAAGTAGERP